MLSWKTIVGVACAALLALLAPPALARPTPQKKAMKRPAAERAPASQQALRMKKVVRADGSVAYVATTPLIVEGRIAKPNAFYLLQRAPLGYSRPLKPAPLARRIVETVRRAPF